MKAAKASDADIVAVLLDHGADVHANDDAALCAATRAYRPAAVIRTLLRRGADPNARGGEALAIATSPTEGCRLEVVQALVDGGADVAADDHRALRSAAAARNVAAVRFLLDRGADVHARDDAALQAAVRANCLPVVEALLQRGANVNAGGDQALQAAAAENNLALVCVLLAHGADASAQDSEAVRKAAASTRSPESRAEVIRLLVGHGARADVGSSALSGSSRQRRTVQRALKATTD